MTVTTDSTWIFLDFTLDDHGESWQLYRNRIIYNSLIRILLTERQQLIHMESDKSFKISRKKYEEAKLKYFRQCEVFNVEPKIK